MESFGLHTDSFTVEDVKRGYVWDEENRRYICVSCGEAFEQGEVFPVEGRFYEAGKAAGLHVEKEHPDYIVRLIDEPSRHIALTDKQKELLKLMARGKTDKEISRITGAAAATVRHQRFVFREKAKFARRYLAMYEAVLESGRFSGSGKKIAGSGDREGSPILPVPDHARMVDERFVITEEERDHVLETAFSSLEPLRLKQFSPKEKKKVVILTRIIEEFERKRDYTEKEVNQILAEIYDDFATLRRYLVEYGFLERQEGGRRYRRL